MKSSKNHDEPIRPWITPTLELIMLADADVLTTSGGGSGSGSEYEGEWDEL